MPEFDASNPKHVAIARRAAKESQRQQRMFMGHIMSTATGREWMHSKLLLCHVFDSSFTGQSLTSAFKEGERNIGLVLLADIMQFCPDQFVVMMREANARDSANDARRQRSDEDSNGRDNEPPAYRHPAFDEPANAGLAEGTEYAPNDGLDEGDEAD